MYEKLMLDTCALIWIAMGGGNLTHFALDAIEKAKRVYVSSISSFEISLKHQKGGIDAVRPGALVFGYPGNSRYS